MTAAAILPRFAASHSTNPDLSRALDEVTGALRGSLAGPPDLLMLFVTPHHAAGFATLGADLRAATGARVLLGVTGESLVAGGREIEDRPALSVWGAVLPQTQVRGFSLSLESTAEGPALVGWPDDLPPRWPAGAALLLLGDPFSFPADLLAQRLAEDQPEAPLLGGMASGGWQPGQNRLWLDDAVFDSGAVAVWIHGAMRVRSLVSQGCRPIGRPLVITKAERNVIHELGGRPPLAYLQELFENQPPADQALMRRGLHVGRVINEYQSEFRRGDFLIRNVVGVDQASGAVAVGDYLRAGQTVQFHVRDAQSASEDLASLLATIPPRGADQRGGLLFTCNGRGTRLFDQPDHDAQAVHTALGPLALAGFFAQGELGPVGGINFVHGFTASLALFEAAD